MITVEPYNPAWGITFENLKAVYTQGLHNLPHQIEHVGSTSVPGLWAKPVIDIDIIVPHLEVSKEAIILLKDMGYTHVGDLGIPGREAFKRMDDSAPYTIPRKEWPKHNLYVCLAGCTSLLNHLHLRNYLLQHPKAVEEYSHLKKQLAIQYANNIDMYVEGKTAFITAILKQSGFDENSLKSITAQNKAK